MSISNAQTLTPIAHIKGLADHWRVYEVLDLAFSGQGEHAYFYIEKTSLNTADIAAMLAADFNLAPVAIGYAGRKDKHAVTRQWFSVPTKENTWQPKDVRVEVLDARRSDKKLRRGDHTANQFELRLTGVQHWSDALAFSLQGVFPNYFGPQRLSTGNIEQAKAWLQAGSWGRNAPGQPRGARRRKQSDKGMRGWHLSVLRSLLFNAVLDRRVVLGNFASEIQGDLMVQGSPTGPLWGRGRSQVSGQAADVESSALVPYQDICEALEYAGVSMARRVLAQRPGEFSAQQISSDEVVLRFTLPPGAYATTLLGSQFDIVDDSQNI
jgi:tRNA pseudouridine13 synthase